MTKKFSFSLCLFFLCGGWIVFAQETDSVYVPHKKIKTFKEVYRSAAFNNVIKFSPVSPIIGQIPVAGELRMVYERFINYNNSLTIGASFNYISIPYKLLELVADTTGVRMQLWGGRGQVGYRYYPLKQKDAPDGLWLGPIASYNYARISNVRGNGSYIDYHFINAGFIVGYQVQMRRNWFFEAFSGLGYRNNFGVYRDGISGRIQRYNLAITPLPFLQHVKFYLAVHFGYAF
jgi:hypothetical protein